MILIDLRIKSDYYAFIRNWEGADMDKSEKELEYLIMQRNLIYQSILEFTKTFQKVVLGVFASFTGIFTLLFQSEKPIDLVVYFIYSQLFFGVSYFVMGLLFANNNDREYIKAIDTYIKEKYNIKTLFYQGELSVKHISRIDSPFSKITLVGGVAAILIGIAVLAFLLNLQTDIIIKYPLQSTVIIIEIVIASVLIFKNWRYKANGKSKYYTDCINFLRSGSKASFSTRKLRKLR